MRRIYSLFALAALILSACTKTTTDAPQQLSPELSVDVEGVINMGAEGGTATINYTITNPVEGLTLEATTEQDWIGNIAIAESVTLDVDANHTTESRVGVVTLTYGTESITIGIQQEGATSSGEILFEITSERKMAFNF